MPIPMERREGVNLHFQALPLLSVPSFTSPWECLLRTEGEMQGSSWKGPAIHHSPGVCDVTASHSHPASLLRSLSASVWAVCSSPWLSPFLLQSGFSKMATSPPVVKANTHRVLAVFCAVCHRAAPFLPEIFLVSWSPFC